MLIGTKHSHRQATEDGVQPDIQYNAVAVPVTTVSSEPARSNLCATDERSKL